jgi:hypothetical protein
MVIIFISRVDTIGVAAIRAHGGKRIGGSRGLLRSGRRWMKKSAAPVPTIAVFSRSRLVISGGQAFLAASTRPASSDAGRRTPVASKNVGDRRGPDASASPAPVDR